MKKRILSALLCLVMCLSLLPTTVAEAQEGRKAIQLGTGDISGYSQTDGYDYLYMGWDLKPGTTKFYPIKWRVLDTKTNMDGAREGDGLFLLSEYVMYRTDGVYGRLFDDAEFHTWQGEWHRGGGSPDNDDHSRCVLSNSWRGSSVQYRCESASWFDWEEADALLKTTKSDREFHSVTGTGSSDVTFAEADKILDGDRVFLLSAEEATSSVYGFSQSEGRVACYAPYINGYVVAWGLRSAMLPSRSSDYYKNSPVGAGVGIVDYGGKVQSLAVSVEYDVFRPACNLNPEHVLFVSAAKGQEGKENAEGALTPIGSYTGNEWNLTLLDRDRSFAVKESSATVDSGDTLTLHYSNAYTSDYGEEWISGILADKNGQAMYYGRLQQSTTADGTVDVDVPSGLASGTYTLYLFNEMYRSSEEEPLGDVASAFQTITLRVGTTPVTSAGYSLDPASYAVGQRIFDIKVTSDANNVGILPLAGYNQGNGIAILTEDPKTTGITSVVTDRNAVFEADRTYYLGVTASAADGYNVSRLTAGGVTLNGSKQAYTLLTFNGVEPAIRLLPVFRLDPLNSSSVPTLSSSIVASTGKIRLSWTAVDWASKYYIYRCTDGTNYKYYDSTTKTTYTNSSVTPGTTYYYKVVAVAPDGMRSDYSNRSYRTADCAKPSVSSSNVSTGGIKLTWKSVDGAVKYYIYRSTDGGKNYSFYDSTKNTSYTNKSVTPGYSYYYKVKAICSNTNGNSAYSNVANRTADCIAPKVSSSNVSTGGIKLTWSAVEGASKYYVYRCTDGENYKFYDSTTKTTYTNKSVTPGQTYYYKLVAVCGKSSYGNSAYSNVASRTADCVTPTLTVQLSNGKPQLKWSAIDGASKYYIYRSTDGKSFSFFDSTTRLSYTNTGAKSGTTYYYKLVAVCGKSTYGNSAYSNIVSIKSK